MSYTVQVFSPQAEPLLKEHLKTEIERRGFAIAFCAYARTIKEFASDEGPLSAGFEILVGCETDSAYAGQFKRIGQTRNITALRGMLAAVQVCQCAISCQVPYDIGDDWDEEEIEELLESSEPEYVEALRRARSEYSVQANIFAGGVEFAAVVWRAIGAIVGGMLEDAQQDIIEFVNSHES